MPPLEDILADLRGAAPSPRAEPMSAAPLCVGGRPGGVVAAAEGAAEVGPRAQGSRIGFSGRAVRAGRYSPPRINKKEFASTALLRLRNRTAEVERQGRRKRSRPSTARRACARRSTRQSGAPLAEEEPAAQLPTSASCFARHDGRARAGGGLRMRAPARVLYGQRRCAALGARQCHYTRTLLCRHPADYALARRVVAILLVGDAQPFARRRATRCRGVGADGAGWCMAYAPWCTQVRQVPRGRGRRLRRRRVRQLRLAAVARRSSPDRRVGEFRGRDPSVRRDRLSRAPLQGDDGPSAATAASAGCATRERQAPMHGRA